MHQSIQSVLVTTNFSDVAANAVETAAGIAYRQHALLHLLHVDESSDEASSDSVEPGADKASLLATLAAQMEDRYGIRCISRMVEGTVSDAVIGYAQGMACHLVVMGTRALPDGERHAIGRHAYAVLLRSQCPLLVVPAVAKAEAFKTIVFPVRAVPKATEKYGFLKAIIAQNDSTLHVAGMADEGSAECSTYVGGMVDLLSRQLEREGVKFSAEMHCCAAVPEAILGLAQEKATDLLVITATLEADFLHLFSSSFTKKIMQQASTAVLFLRPDGDYAGAKRQQSAATTAGISSAQLFNSLN